MSTIRTHAEQAGAQAPAEAPKLKTFAVEIWVSDCYLVTGIEAPSPDEAERRALDLWERGELEPVPNIQEVSSTHVEEVQS